MGSCGGSRGVSRSGSGGSISQSHTGVQVTGGGGGGAAPVSNVPTSGSAFDDKDAQALRLTFDDVYDDPDFSTARKLYISDSNPNGDGYSHSQNLNYKLDNGLPLNANEKFIDDNIQSGMRPIGKDSNLVRYSHDDILKACGVQDYTTMSQSQLQNALVGKTLKTTSYMSTSYDAKKNPFAPGMPQGGGREVVMNVKVGKNTNVVLGAKKQSEIIIDKGTDFRITGVRFDGTYATPRGRYKSVPRIVVDIETY